MEVLVPDWEWQGNNPILRCSLVLELERPISPEKVADIGREHR